jgi:hypothetical protein
MEKKEIIQLCDSSHNFIGTFYNKFSEENINSNFSDWNAKDVIGHILFWVDHCGEKLYKIKKGLPCTQYSDPYKENENTYIKNKNMQQKILFEKYNNAIFNCKNAVDLFTENELLDKTFPTGFNFELWRYMVMDIYVHPTMHLLHYYIKTKHYDDFINIIKYSYNIFMEYSDNDINVFDFSGYYENKNKQKEQFSKLKNDGNEIIKQIMEINIK